jgi:hypothetical protein
MAKVKGVSVGGDATVWCLDRDGRLHKWEGNRWWANAEAIAEEVAVGSSAHVWCRNNRGELFRATSPQATTGWQKLPDYPGDGLRSISANRDGELWIVNGAAEVWRLAGNLWTRPGNAGNGRIVSTGGRDRVCYVDAGGALRVSGVDVGGLTWASIRRPIVNNREVSLKSISYSVEGAIWASDVNDQMYKRGRTDSIWRHNPNGVAVQVSVGPTTEVWCVNAAGQIWRASHALGNVNTYWQPMPEPSSTTFTVRQGDTVFSIVNHLCPGITEANRQMVIDELVRVNGLSRYTDRWGRDIIRIETGQTLHVPPCP